MTRQERRAINRANAKLSTGPATEAGKETSKLNALKHGLTSMKPYLPGEEAAYEQFVTMQSRRFAAETETELDLLQTVIDTGFRLKRIAALEARLFADPNAEPHKLVRSLDTLSRHENRLRKLLTKSIETLAMAIQFRQKRHMQMELQANGFVLQSSTGLPACDSQSDDFETTEDRDFDPNFEEDEAQQAA